MSTCRHCGQSIRRRPWKSPSRRWWFHSGSGRESCPWPATTYADPTPKGTPNA